MPLTPEMRRGIDQIRDYLYGGGYPDPLSNAEQLAFLFFFYLIEGIDTDNQLQAEDHGRPYNSLFEGDWTLRNPLNAPSKGQEAVPKGRFLWSVWARGMNGEPLVRFVRDEVFPFFATVADDLGASFMTGARLVIDEPTVLTQVVGLINGLGLDRADADTKGDLFEHVLRQIKQAGELGQFRTPRHIIRAIVGMVDPKKGEMVYDPAAGTAGFLVAAYDRIRLSNSSPAGVEEVDVDGKRLRRGAGDRLSDREWDRLRHGTFFGNDVDPKMVNLATMNLTLRGLPDVRILRRNVLTTTLDRSERAELGLPLDGHDVVLANPPFSGKVDKDRIVEDVRVGTTTATELLFLKYMLDSLKPGGRCGVIVPEGVLFGSTGAHKELRRMLVESNMVEAVLSLPGGVFQPYSGVKTSALLFRKGGRTERVLFLHADADGYKLDANHDTPVEADDLPGLVEAYHGRVGGWAAWQQRDPEGPWPEKWWFPTAEELRKADYNLSASRWRPRAKERIEHRDPLELLDELRALETEIVEEVDALAERLREDEVHVDPSGHELRGLEAVAEIGSGITKGRKLDGEPVTAVPYLRVANVQDGHLDLSEVKTIPATARDVQRYALRPGDLLLTEGGDPDKLGRGAVWSGQIPGCLHQNHVFRVRPNIRVIVPDYLARIVGSDYGKAYFLRVAKRTTGIASINRTQLGAFPVPVVALDMQHRIVDRLNRAAGIRRLREEALEKARAVVPALFLDMFGDPVANPRGWPDAVLGDVIKFGPQNGLYRPASDYGDGVRILRIDSFEDGGITDPASLKRLRAHTDVVAHYGLVAGDIVINRVNSPPQLGKSALIPDLDEPLVFDSNMMRLRVDTRRLLPEVMATALQLEPVRRELTRNAKHAINQSSINQGDVKALRVILPPLDLQHRFADGLADLHSIVAQAERALAVARDVERSLMARLLI